MSSENLSKLLQELSDDELDSVLGGAYTGRKFFRPTLATRPMARSLQFPVGPGGGSSNCSTADVTSETVTTCCWG